MGARPRATKTVLGVRHFSCSGCHEMLPEDNFTVCNTSSSGRKSRCRVCTALNDAKPEKREARRAYKYVYRYGITLDKRSSLLRAQSGKCAICSVTDTTERPLFVDHDHVTGHVRGLICHNCNTLLGHAKDSESILMAAIVYLRESPNGV